MPTSRFFRIILLFFVLVCAEIFILLQFNDPARSEISNIDSRQFLYPLTVRGLNVNIFQGNNVIRIKADDFEVSPRKFFIFNVKQLNEITLNNVTVEFNKYQNQPADVNVDNIRQIFLPLADGGLSSPEALIHGTVNTGLITRGVFKNLVLEIYRKRSVALKIIAERACAEIKESKIKFHDAVLENMETKEIVRSKLIILKTTDDHFYIPGQYVKLSPSGVIRGKGLQIRLRDP